MKTWDQLSTLKQRTVIVLFFAGLVWAVLSNLNTPFHMDAEAGELWAASEREKKCDDARMLEQLILEAEIRLATENLNPEARELIAALKEKREKEREAIRKKYDC